MYNKEPGYVYILTNPSFCKDWVKIVKNGRPVDVHSKELTKELDNTAVACTRFLSPCAQPDIETLARISKLLGVGVEDLFNKKFMESV